MNPSVAVKKDDWLSEGLGKSVFTVIVPPSGDISGLMEKLRGDSLYQARVPVDCTNLLNDFLELGFSFVNTNIELILGTLKVASTLDVNVRVASPVDQPRVAELATKAFTNDRFHLDSQIDNLVAESIKAKWAKNYFTGDRGSQMVIAELNAKLIGFLLLMNKTKTIKAIDLVAVDDDYKGRGVAGQMIGDVVHNYLKTGDKLTVTTQLRNASSLRLYEKLGFRYFDASYMLHLHTEKVSQT